MRELIRLEKRVLCKIKHIAEYKKGKYVAELGIGVSTPCIEVQDERTRETFRRAIVAQYLGKRPGKAHILHRCDNRKCCNPQHLFWGTASDNVRDCILKGRRPGKSVPEVGPVLVRLTAIRARMAKINRYIELYYAS